MGEPVNLELSPDEALVLFEWLSRTDQDDALEPLVEHWSEQLALWAVLGKLEGVLAEPFDPSYKELLLAARERMVAEVTESDRRRGR